MIMQVRPNILVDCSNQGQAVAVMAEVPASFYNLALAMQHRRFLPRVWKGWQRWSSQPVHTLCLQ